MSLKFKMVFYNFMIFLVIFDVIYLFVWIFSIHMNPLKAILVALIAALLTPWAYSKDTLTGKKVALHNFGYDAYKKYIRKVR